MEISLNKKVIVISGGTKGVGKQLALQCATDGAHVIISGRDEASAASIIEAAKGLSGSIEFKKTDLHSVSSIRELFAYVTSKFNKLDGFVNYAGVTPAASLTECSESLFDEVFDIDIKDGICIITLSDSGIPYNPLEKLDPDVTLSAEDRQIGGLGIFMVKKSVDDMVYEYKNGQNILKLIKKI